MNTSRIYRLLRLITLLQQGRGYTATALASELDVSRRTIFRDLNMLELAHIPYYFDAQAGGYRISQHFFLPPVNLTLPEALAVLILAGRMRPAGELPLLTHGTQAAAKIESALPPPIRDHAASLISALSVNFGPVASHEGLDGTFSELSAAVAERRTCRILYLSLFDGKELDLTVRPLRLVFQNRAWYLLAWSAQHRQVRTFKLSRLRSLQVLNRTFTKPRRLDVDRYFGDAWCMIPEGRIYEVHLHFEPKVAANVAEVRWHRSQRVQFNDDGSAEFFAAVDGLGEIGWWVMGYGDQVRVVAPGELARRVAESAAATLRHYQEAH